jgi:hypothetical protein
MGLSVARPEPVAAATESESGVLGALTMAFEPVHADVGTAPGTAIAKPPK